MIRLAEISKYELPAVIYISYEGDVELLEKYHVEKFTLQEAVSKELELINNMSAILEFRYFKVLNVNSIIGYLVVSGDFLYSFAVSIYSRTKEILTDWWQVLNSELGNEMKVGVMSNNIRAIDYLKKRGMKITWENPEMKEVNEILLT